MFDGLSRGEVIAWLVCLALAIGLTSGGAYLVALSLLSADVADTMPQSAHSRTAP
jgi:hypothetical protein